MSRPTTLLTALFLLPVCATAQEITASSALQSVTVYLDRAELTRTISVELPAGDTTVLLSGLPARLLSDSLRIRGQGTGRLLIGAVETRRTFGEQPAAEKERQLQQTLQQLLDDKAVLDGQQKALDTQAAFIEHLASAPSTSDKDGPAPLAPEKWPTAWQSIGKGMAETNAARSKLAREQRTLEEKIRRVQAELNQVRTGRKDSLTAAIQVTALQPGKASFELSYQVPDASWTPLYDAQLDSESGRLQLTQAAHVRQATGEDWSGVALTVSTARPSAGAAMPELAPWWLDFYQPRPLSKEMKLERSKMMLDEAPMAAAPAAPQEAEELVAEQGGSEFSVRYRVAGKVTVPADNSRLRFVLDKQTLKTKLAVRTTPRLDPRAFLYAEADYAGAPLLAGEWRLVRDEVYVGSLRRSTLRPGEPLALAFGADDAIEVNYITQQDERAQKGVFSKERQVQRRYRIEITNRHTQPLPLSVYDQVPVARDEQIKVSLSPDTTPVTERDPEGRVGVLLWRLELKPQVKQSLQFGYSVSYPQGRELPGF